MTFDLERIALWWGPGILLLMLFGYGFLRLARYWIEKSMEVKRQQMENTFGIARQYIEQFLSAQRSQAQALSRLATSVEQSDSRESFEHQEMLIALKAMHHAIGELPCRGVALLDDAQGTKAAPGFSPARAGLKAGATECHIGTGVGSRE